jgi:hypothetical protein
MDMLSYASKLSLVSVFFLVTGALSNLARQFFLFLLFSSFTGKGRLGAVGEKLTH